MSKIIGAIVAVIGAISTLFFTWKLGGQSENLKRREAFLVKKEDNRRKSDEIRDKYENLKKNTKDVNSAIDRFNKLPK